MMCQLSVVESKSATFPSEKARHLLDDSVLESRSPRRGPALTSSSAVTNGLSLGKRLWLRTAAWHSRRVLMSVCHCAAPGGPTPQRGLPQESPCQGLCFLASGFVLILPVAPSTNRWKKQPDTHPRPAVPGWQLAEPGRRPAGLCPGRATGPSLGAKWGGCPRTALRATGFSRVSLSSLRKVSQGG